MIFFDQTYTPAIGQKVSDKTVRDCLLLILTKENFNKKDMKPFHIDRELEGPILFNKVINVVPDHSCKAIFEKIVSKWSLAAILIIVRSFAYFCQANV